MPEKKRVRFIRKGGRVIPIRDTRGLQKKKNQPLKRAMRIAGKMQKKMKKSGLKVFKGGRIPKEGMFDRKKPKFTILKGKKD